MIRRCTTGLVLAALVACGGKGGDQQAQADSLARDLELAPAESTTAVNDQPTADQAPQAQPTPPATTPPTTTSTPKPKPAKPPTTSPAPAPAPAAPAPRTMTLAAGTNITAAADDSLHSRHNKVGETFRATVGEDVKDASGRVVIPAGSQVTFKVLILEPAKSKSDEDGKVRIGAQQVTINGQSYPIAGEAGTRFVEHELRGQGVTAGAAVRVGAGAAGGAVAGKVVGGKTGAIIGGIAGAAGGAVLASKTADRDVVVMPGFKVIFTLASDFTITR